MFLEEKIKGVRIKAVTASEGLAKLLDVSNDIESDVDDLDTPTTNKTKIKKALTPFEKSVEASLKKIKELNKEERKLSKQFPKIAKDLQTVKNAKTKMASISTAVTRGLGTAALGVASGTLAFQSASGLKDIVDASVGVATTLYGTLDDAGVLPG